MEEIDQAIVRLLAGDGRMSYTDLGKATGLSSSAVHQRVRRLEQRGVIKGYTIVVDHDQLGLDGQDGNEADTKLADLTFDALFARAEEHGELVLEGVLPHPATVVANRRDAEAAAGTSGVVLDSASGGTSTNGTRELAGSTPTRGAPTTPWNPPSAR